ncbi:MAG: hypothetical protein ABH843_03645 [Candidatus Omnitrophota bacterium]
MDRKIFKVIAGLMVAAMLGAFAIKAGTEYNSATAPMPKATVNLAQAVEIVKGTTAYTAFQERANFLAEVAAKAKNLGDDALVIEGAKTAIVNLPGVGDILIGYSDSDIPGFEMAAANVVQAAGGINFGVLTPAKLESLKTAGEQGEAGAKQSSAGQVQQIVDSIMPQLQQFQQTTDVNKLTEQLVNDVKAQIDAAIEQLKALTGLEANEIGQKATVQKQLTHYANTIEESQAMAQDINALNKPLGDAVAVKTNLIAHVKETKTDLIGTLIIRLGDYSGVQQDIVKEYFSKGSEYRTAAIEKFGMNIVLDTEFTDDDRAPIMLALSDKKIPQAPDAFLLNVKIVDGQIPIDKALSATRVLLLYLFVGEENAVVEKAVIDIFGALSKGMSKLDQAALRLAVKNKVFELVLPVEPIGEEYYPELLRIRLWALVAA